MKNMKVALSLIFTLFLCVDPLKAYNSLLYKKTSNEKFARSIAQDRPGPPNMVSAYTKAKSEVDIDHPEENRGENHIVYEGYAYLKAYGWKGTYSISASAYSQSLSQSGKWWSSVYKQLNPKQTVSYSFNLDDSYAIDYFSAAPGKAAVKGTLYQSDPTSTFKSEDDWARPDFSASTPRRLFCVCPRGRSNP